VIAAWFACACAALLAGVGFLYRVAGGPAAGPVSAAGAGFFAAVFLIYAAAVLRGTSRVRRLTPERASMELLGVATVGFVLVFFALAMK
jgi:hypothetical protein